MATYQEMFADLDRQEQENEQRYKAAFHAYFESKAAIAAARSALKVAQENYPPGEQVETTGE